MKTTGNPITPKDSLLLLLQSLFSVTERVNAGGDDAKAPLEVFQHRYNVVQLQIVGLHDLLRPFDAAQIFEGIGLLGARFGYSERSMIVWEDKVGPIARIDIAS